MEDKTKNKIKEIVLKLLEEDIDFQIIDSGWTYQKILIQSIDGDIAIKFIKDYGFYFDDGYFTLKYEKLQGRLEESCK